MDSAAKAQEFYAGAAARRSRRWSIIRGEGDGATLYFGQYMGARFVSIALRGFNGWASYPSWMPGGWEFFNPRVSVGRLYMDVSRSWSREVKIPARLWDFYYWHIKPSGRRYRHLRHEEPIEAVDASSSTRGPDERENGA